MRLDGWNGASDGATRDMSLFDNLIIAVGLSMDAFAVSLGAGTHNQMKGWRSVIRLAFHFGLFQCLMTLLGWGLGVYVEKLISTVDHWVAFGLLAVVGGRMIIQGFENNPEVQPANPSKGFCLVSLSVATSLDAMAIGLSFGMLRINVWYPSLLIGVVTALLSFIGIKLGSYLGERFGKRMEVFGGVLLVAIGLRILWQHVMP